MALIRGRAALSGQARASYSRVSRNGSGAAVQERTRLQRAAELAIMFAGCLGGVLHLPAGVVVVGLGVLLLFVSDRGQHRELADKAPQRPRWVVIGFSMMAYLTLNMVAVAACYVLGGVVGWLFGVG